MVRVALGLEYDGSRFCGWQTQPNACAIQDAIEVALAEIACEPITTASAGRTDTGVHALAQVVHFDTQAIRPESAWVRGVNALLPPAVSVRWAREMAPEFHARFSAQARRYRYVLLNRSVRPGLAAGITLHLIWRRCNAPRTNCWASMISAPFAPPNAKPKRPCVH